MMKNNFGQMPTKQVDQAMMEPKAQQSAIRNRRMRLAGDMGGEEKLENVSALHSPGAKAKAPKTKMGVTAEEEYRAGGMKDNIGALDTDLFSLIRERRGL